MQKLFNRILVPVDFTHHSKRIVEQATELAVQYDCSIHLLHVIDESHPLAFENVKSGVKATSMLPGKQAIQARLDQLAETAALVTGIAPDKVLFSIEYGSWNDSIVRFASMYKIDLVLVAQQGSMGLKPSMELDTDLIATETNTAVITVPCNRCVNRYSSVMIPITDFLPVKKMMYGVYIALKNNISIRLLGIENASTKDKMMHYLEKAHQLISDNCSVKVELEKTESADVNEAVKKYAHHKHTDLIILEPANHQKKTGFLTTFIGNLVQKYASPPVLTISAG